MKIKVILISSIFLASCHSEEEIKLAEKENRRIIVERIIVNKYSIYYRWCDGKHLMFAPDFSSGAPITVIPNDPRCAVENHE